MRYSSIFLLFYSLLFCNSAIYALAFTAWQADRAYNQGDYEKACMLYGNLIEQSSEDTQALYNLGKTLYKKKDFQQALTAFEKVAGAPHICSGQAEQAFFNHGDCACQLKNYPTALRSYEKVLEINKENKHAQERINNINKLLEKEQKQQQEQEQKQKQEEKNKQQKEQQKQEQDTNQEASEQKQKQEPNNQKHQNQSGTEQNTNNSPQDNKGHKHNNEQENQQTQEDKKGSSERGNDHTKDSSIKNKGKVGNADKPEGNSSENKEHDEPSTKEANTTDSIAHSYLTDKQRVALQEIEKEDAQAYKMFITTQLGATGDKAHDQITW